MKLNEILSFVTGDDGGMHWQLNDAIRNMQKHSGEHKNKEVRDLCVKASNQLKAHSNNPNALFSDPHSMMKIVAVFRREPDVIALRSALFALGNLATTGD